jgi:hypothetical protein
VAAGVAVATLTRAGHRNVIADRSVEPGVLGGRFRDDETGRVRLSAKVPWWR